MTVTPGLSYCNHCGAKLGGTKGESIDKSSEIRPETLVFAIAAVFIFGLLAIIGLMAVLKYVFNPAENLGLIIFFTMVSFLIMLAVETVFVWMLLRRRKSSGATSDTGQLEKKPGKVPAEPKRSMLPEPALTVTEHTTRTLEPVGMNDKAD